MGTGYIRDPDGNLIELVHHPLGLVDADGNTLAVPSHPESHTPGRWL